MNEAKTEQKKNDLEITELYAWRVKYYEGGEKQMVFITRTKDLKEIEESQECDVLPLPKMKIFYAEFLGPCKLALKDSEWLFVGPKDDMGRFRIPKELCSPS